MAWRAGRSQADIQELRRAVATGLQSHLSAEEAILFDAPMAGYDEDFKTMALKVMSFFMLNDRPDFTIQGVNTLEKIGHQYSFMVKRVTIKSFHALFG